ncbi:IS66-like element accessory protein TnpA [Piscinibacter gummiphilus]|uniref:Transposase n=1 Tax=Piscinibacter gummiphilus TaxID=946333 RepID=A0ABZ0D258_9BURK|nr:transposase [Piscinibacter gummiphilus]WOB11332.1 transposase [Piscinibacter gummiphilus]
MGTENSRKRRRYGQELKAQILAECDQPGASVAKVAMAHGINANIVHGWRKLAREAGAISVTGSFVPVAVPPVAPRPTEERAIEVELRRGGITVKLRWPMSAAMDLSAWMRELLQ